jgi:penicillin-binding protein 2
MIPASRPRLLALSLVVAALLLGLLGRAWYLQVKVGSGYAALASAERERVEIEPAIRGPVVDDLGAPMVDSMPALVVSVSLPVLWQQGDGGAAVLARLAILLHRPPSAIKRVVRPCTVGVRPPCWPGSPYQPIPIAEHVSSDVALAVLENQRLFPGVTAAIAPVVRYRQPISTDLAQVLGYLQPITASQMRSEGLPSAGFGAVDLVGQAGLEAQYDRELRGVAGVRRLAVNAAGQVIGAIGAARPRPGDYLVTSINEAVQHDTEQALANAVLQSQSAGNPVSGGGAAVVMTTTGRVIAMASYPTYNPAIWTGGVSGAGFRRLFGAAHGEPILNRATQGQYAPGSTWKVTSVAAAVAAGYSLNGTYDCPAKVRIGYRSYVNDGQISLGPMSLYRALVVSCDTVFYNLAYRIYLRDHPRDNVVTSPRAPVQLMQKMELGWGFGRFTGVDLPVGNQGSVPTREWLYYLWKDNAHQGQNWCKNGRAKGSFVQKIEWENCRYGNVWSAGQSVIASIGQGYVTVSPLQLARAYAALANGGTLYSPRVGEALIRPDGRVVRRITPPVVGHLPVAKATLAYIRGALAGVVSSGTAAGAFGGFPLGRVCVAGKTGTAQVSGRKSTSVFASFAPCEHPKFVVVVMIPNSGYGASVSAPAVRRIWDGIFGLEGHKAALPGGIQPGLPHMDKAGLMVPPAGFGAKPPRSQAQHRKSHK